MPDTTVTQPWINLYDPVALVEEFHAATDTGIFRNGRAYDTELAERQATSLREEAYEAAQELYALQAAAHHLEYALDTEDAQAEQAARERIRRHLMALAKELSDVLCVAYGTARVFGIPIEDVFAEVHRANMAGLDDRDAGAAGAGGAGPERPALERFFPESP